MLRPSVEGMVVALGAADLRAEEDADGVVDIGERHPLVAELIADGGIFPQLAIGREHVVDPLVVGAVGGDRPLHPIEIGLAPEVFLRPLREPERVGPDVVQPAHPVRAFQEAVDEGRALVGIGRGEEGARLVMRRDPAAEIEVRAAEKLGIGKQRGGHDAVAGVPLGKEGIDLGRRIANAVARRAIDRGDGECRAVGGVTDRGREPEWHRSPGFPRAGLLGLGREARGGGDDSTGGEARGGGEESEGDKERPRGGRRRHGRAFHGGGKGVPSDGRGRLSFPERLNCREGKRFFPID